MIYKIFRVSDAADGYKELRTLEAPDTRTALKNAAYLTGRLNNELIALPADQPELFPDRNGAITKEAYAIGRGLTWIPVKDVR